MKVVIDIPEEKWSTFQNDIYSGLLDKDLYKSIKNGTPLPDNSTNEDIMKAIFPNLGFHKVTVYDGYFIES